MPGAASQSSQQVKRQTISGEEKVLRPDTTDEAIDLRSWPAALSEIAQEISAHPAFRRLDRISFLGVLSPRYWSSIKPPATLQKLVPCREASDADGSRADHSLAAAHCAFVLSSKLLLSEESQRYALAWGLLHDIATWGLSHTGDAAFTRITGISSQELRLRMITGHPSLPEHLSVKSLLRKIGLFSETLLELFSKKSPDFLSSSHRKIPRDLKVLWSIVHSPLTPDTLEGIWRVGRTYGLDLPHPTAVLSTFTPTLFGPMVQSGPSIHIFNFWRGKRDIYRLFINCDEVVLWESRCSNILRDSFHSASLEESLDLTDEILIDSLTISSDSRSPNVMRYKPPRRYGFAPDIGRQKKLKRDFRIDELSQILRSEPKELND